MKVKPEKIVLLNALVPANKPAIILMKPATVD
jgi:hypothetical protein